MKFIRLGFENPCGIVRQVSQSQHTFSRPCLVNLISKDAPLVFSLYIALKIAYKVVTENQIYKIIPAQSVRSSEVIFGQCLNSDSGSEAFTCHLV